MQRVNKRLEEKIQAISKIQKQRKKKSQPSQPAEDNKIELPPIVNALSLPSKTSPLIPRMAMTLTSHSHAIINDTLTHFKDQKINRIIFASPLANRLGKTYYRSSQRHTLNNYPSRRFSQERQKEMERRKAECEQFFSHPLRINKKIEQNFTAPPRSTSRQQKIQNTQQPVDQMYHNTPEDHTLIKNIVPHRSGRFHRLNNHRKSICLQQRYSPWKNEERDQELAL